jgi:hypothetical protein
MLEFIRKHAANVIGVLSGFDRLYFRGILRKLNFLDGLGMYLGVNHILLKDASSHFMAVSERIKAASVRKAEERKRPVIYLESAQTNKEQKALEIARRDGIRQGLIAVLSTVEVCRSFQICRNRESKQLEPRSVVRKCLHYYHYFQHPELGLIHARLQTWFPFTLNICINGREWLAHTLRREGVGFRKSDNCFTWLEDPPYAQKLADGQLRTNWEKLLSGIARQVNPLVNEAFGKFRTEYYWTAFQSEWATDVMFKSPQALAELYPSLVRHGIMTFKSPDVLRFLGQKCEGQVHGNYKGEVSSDVKTRPEGVRIKHSVEHNSVKMYDKAGRVLRVETTMNRAYGFKTYRPKEGDPNGPKTWRILRKGVADMQRRAEICQKCNERYLDAQAKTENGRTLEECVGNAGKRVMWKGRPARALNLLGQDARVLEIVGRGEYVLKGFRNRDLQTHLYEQGAASKEEQKRRSGQVTRLLRLLQAHGIIRKVQKTHRYQLSAKGRELVVALATAKAASVEKLSALAA